MSKVGKKRLYLNAIRENAAKKRGGTDIEIAFDEETVFTFPAPLFWSDEIHQVVAKGKVIDTAKTLLGGDEEYERFKAAGGQASDVILALNEYNDDQGVTPGE